MTKPFRFDELAGPHPRPGPRDPRIVEATVLRGGWRRPSTCVRDGCMWVADRTTLTAREFALAETLLPPPPARSLSREQLLSHVWGYDYDPGSNVVEVYVRYLRRKLGADAIDRPSGAWATDWRQPSKPKKSEDR